MDFPKPVEKDYPKLVRIKDETYHIVFASKLDEDDLGACDDDMKLVILSRNQSQKELLASYWHELLHGFEKEYNVKLGHPLIRKLEWFIADAHFPFIFTEEKNHGSR